MAEGIFSDAGLAIPVTQVTATQNADSSTPPIDYQFWIGHTDSAKKIQANSDPGVDNIVISIADTDPGTGHEDTEIKLALTEAGLDTAVAGDPLDLGEHTINGGSSNAVTFWMRVDDATGVVATEIELSIETVELIVTAI